MTESIETHWRGHVLASLETAERDLMDALEATPLQVVDRAVVEQALQEVRNANRAVRTQFAAAVKDGQLV